jgi:hypothetical protein
MRKRIRRVRRPRRVAQDDPTTNPVIGSEELEGWDNEIEDWMMAGTK